jgi:hypothetical protein
VLGYEIAQGRFSLSAETLTDSVNSVIKGADYMILFRKTSLEVIPLTSSKWVKAKSNFDSCPLITKDWSTAHGPACIGWAALSTSTIASAMRNLLVIEVDRLEVLSAVCPIPDHP